MASMCMVKIRVSPVGTGVALEGDGGTETD